MKENYKNLMGGIMPIGSSVYWTGYIPHYYLKTNLSLSVYVVKLVVPSDYQVSEEAMCVWVSLDASWLKMIDLNNENSL